MGNAVSELSVKRLVKFSGEGSLKAYCDLAIGNEFLVRGLRVISGRKGLFVSMPRQQGKDGKWYDQVVLSDDARQEVSRIVLGSYQQELTDGNE